ncbi:uncharacterized protein [Euwallacea similis]|uniref:uncharacterized protein n=1 Tax=Euwallacea similis TaxID=1736056 RepID=UPI00344D4F9F
MTSFSDGKTSNKQNYFKIRNETQNRRSTEPKSRHTAKEYAYESESRRQGKKEDCQTLPDSGTAAEVSPCSSKEESKLSFKKDVAAKGDKKAQGSPKNAKRKMKSKKEIICNKCRRLKRGYDSGGHNNIIVSNYPQSHGTVLIKMQSKDSTREFDRIMAELNYQKSEIERLNDMYQKMIKSKESQKFTGSSKYNSKKASDASPCGCGRGFKPNRAPS